MPDDPSIHLACFVTPHGFGHAARAAAVMNALQRRNPALYFEIFTSVPQWFFQESLEAPYCYQDLDCDVGMVQPDPLHEDLEATLRRLKAFLPFKSSTLEQLGARFHELGCRAVICDVAALGIAAARQAGLPSFLIENFTWDWIYGQYAERDGRFRAYAQQFRSIYAGAGSHIQTLPACDPGRPDLVTPPASRRPRLAPEAVRSRLNLGERDRMALITMGGLRERFDFLESLTRVKEFTFVIPGGSEEETKRENLLLLPHHNRFYHPDLVHASDVVIGKLGYSTLAETFYAGIPFGYIAREGYPEIPALAEFAQREKVGFSIPVEVFHSGAWATGLLENVVSFQRATRSVPDGAELAAEFILKKLSLQVE